MKKNQVKKTGAMLRRELRRKKLLITDGNAGTKINADQLANALQITRSHAHKIINGAAKLTPANNELLQFKFLGKIPDFDGYYITPDGIRAPNDYMITIADMENISLTSQLLGSYERDNETLREEIEILKARIEWLNQKLAQPERLRKYTGPRVVKFEKSIFK